MVDTKATLIRGLADADGSGFTTREDIAQCLFVTLQEHGATSKDGYLDGLCDAAEAICEKCKAGPKSQRKFSSVSSFYHAGNLFCVASPIWDIHSNLTRED